MLQNIVIASKVITSKVDRWKAKSPSNNYELDKKYIRQHAPPHPTPSLLINQHPSVHLFWSHERACCKHKLLYLLHTVLAGVVVLAMALLLVLSLALLLMLHMPLSPALPPEAPKNILFSLISWAPTLQPLLTV